MTLTRPNARPSSRSRSCSRSRTECGKRLLRLSAKGHDIKEVLTHEAKLERVNQKKDRIKKIKAMRSEKLGKKLKVAQNSTASMGKFDKKVNRDEVKHQLKKKKRILPGLGSAQDEVKRNKGTHPVTGRTAVSDRKVKNPAWLQETSTIL